METDLNILREQLQQTREIGDSIFKHQGTIKNWCVTVWVAVFAAIATNRVSVKKETALFALFAPVILFWFLEGVHGGMRWLFLKQSAELERRIANKELSLNGEADIFLISRYWKHTNTDKLLAFFKAAFTAETVLIFYLCLAIASVVVAYVLL